ncbi:MAG: cyclic nucleotide-binding domain-containing protein [Verrucomicrobiota bacterium]|nr:cyclic nucleotide-binding domain-containing protein [Verrucomicrobiota bacterium]
MFFSKLRRTRELFVVIKKSQVFQDLTMLEWRRIESIMHERHFQNGELVFAEGEEGMGLYLILSGRVQMARNVDNVLKELGQLKRGESFGELTLIDGSGRTAQAVAMENTQLLGFFRPALLDLMQREPRIAAKVYSRLAEQAAQRLRRLLEDKKLAESF